MVHLQRGAATQRNLNIGTRGSRLALAQARIARERIRRAAPGLDVEITTITTSGDRDQQSRLVEIGGKGAFIREIERALLEKRIDVAVHSFKDVTADLAGGLRLSAFFSPESVCDVLVLREGLAWDSLPSQSRIGTGSMRRRALLRRLRPDLAVVDIRGNIDTRLRKCDEGRYDGIMLSEAGLIRLGLEGRCSVRFSPDSFYPAPGQGVIALETRSDDTAAHELCSLAGDREQRIVSEAEFALLTAVGFDCRAPLGVHTLLDEGIVTMSGFIVKSGREEFLERTASGPSTDPVRVGTMLGNAFCAA